jgi:hypothetical protein
VGLLFQWILYMPVTRHTLTPHTYTPLALPAHGSPTGAALSFLKRAPGSDTSSTKGSLPPKSPAAAAGSSSASSPRAAPHLGDSVFRDAGDLRASEDGGAPGGAGEAGREAGRDVALRLGGRR